MIINLAIHKEASVSILSVSYELLCINWNESQAAAYSTQAIFEWLWTSS